MDNITDLYYIIYADFYRNLGEFSWKRLIKIILTSTEKPPSKFILNLRICQYLLRKKNRYGSILYKILYKIMYIKLLKKQYKYGIEIEPISNIKEGFRLPHCGGIVINSRVNIGKNCEILQGVTIGNNIFKSRYDVAEIGDNVIIGAGAKIIGGVKIGNNVTIGANSVVNKDVPDNAVVGGIPAKILSYKKSIVINNDYMKK